MSFFYDLNKKLDSIRATPEVTHKQLNERDMSRAAKGYEKYGKEGMEALAKAGREGKALDPVRAKYDKYDNTEVDEGAHSQDAMALNPDFDKIGRKPGVMDRMARGAKKVADVIAPGDDELLDRLQKSSGAAPRQPGDKALGYDESVGEAKASKYGIEMHDLIKNASTQELQKMASDIAGGPSGGYGRYKGEYQDLVQAQRELLGPEGVANQRMQGVNSRLDQKLASIGAKNKQQASTDATTSQTMSRAKQGLSGMYEEGAAPMTPKQRSFAKLAPPDNKITFADKIAGAKKEVDEMLGDVAAEAMKKALGGGRGRDQEMEEASTGNAFDYKNRREPETQKSASFVHKGTYGTEYDGDKDDAKAIRTKKKAAADAGQVQRGRGRPKRNADSETGQVMKPDFGAFGVTGKDIKLPKHKGAVTKHKMVGEDDLDPKDQGEYDQEGDMAKDTIKTVVRHAQALEKILGDNDNLPEWVQSKLAKIEGMMTAVDDYMQNQADDDMDMDDDQEPIAEKAVSKKQQRFMGMVSAAKKGEKPASKEVAKVAKTMKKGDAEDFASTKHKGLPEKAAKKNKEEDVEESTTSGSVATSTAAPKAAKGAGGFTFGKGIYDSMNREVEDMISESMSINMSMNNNDDHSAPTRSLTITATDDDATKLAQLLKSAGLGGSDHGYHTMDENYGVNEVSQNSPDYPTNTETAQDNFEYSGGLNKPKSTGQTTVPVIASQEERQYTNEGQGPSDAERLDHYHDLKAGGMDPDQAESEAFGTDDWYNDMNEQDALQRMMEMSGLREANAKPDFLDMDKDGDKQEPMKKAVDDKKDAVKEEDEFNESIQRMREIAGIQEAKKAVDEEKTEEGNKFAHNVLKAKAAGKTEADLDGDGDMEKVRESIFTLTNQWKAYKG